MPMTAPPIYGRGDENLFAAVVVTADTPPLSGYALATLVAGDPDERVLFNTGTLILTFTLSGGAAQGDVLVIPCSNIDENDGDESPVVLLLTNNNGLAVPIPVPAMNPDGIPSTIAVDVSLLEPNASTRTASVWHLEIFNQSDLTFGGGIALYPKRTLDDLEWGLVPRMTHAVTEIKNDHLKRYRAEHQTLERSLECTALTEDLATFTAWYRAQFGSSRPGLLWPQMTGFDAYYGTWPRTFEAQQMRGAEAYLIRIVFDELTKGKPV